MDTEEHIERLKRLKELLREAFILLPAYERGQSTQQVDDLFQNICKLVFTDDFHLHIWDEGSLNQLVGFFKVKPPNPKVFGEKLSRLSERMIFVQQANELFFSMLSNDFSIEEVCKRFPPFTKIDESIILKIESSGHLQVIRTIKSPASEKIEAFVEHLTHDLGVNIEEAENDLRQVIASIKAQETPGRINTLLVNTLNNVGILVPLSIRLEPGKGEVHCLVSGGDDFRAAINMARHLLLSNGFLSSTDDVLYSLDITEANYSGASIGLAVAIAMYTAATNQSIDPYTAFTGNINLEGNQYKITSVKGIRPKLNAAILTGCRRVFIPKQNQTEIGVDYAKKLHIVYVSDITDVLMKLQTTLEPIPGDTLQIRKINLLQAYCQNKGWDLSQPQSIQDGLQFTISPLHPPELKINVYYTGAHSPKKHEKSDFQELLNDLSALDQSTIPILKVNLTFLIKDAELRMQIRQRLNSLGPESREEQHCEYSYRYEDGKENLVIKQYTSGKLLLQGAAGDLYKKILDIIIPLYNLKNPKAQISIEDYLKYETKDDTSIKKELLKTSKADIPLPHIGTDESGKGDYFGPMVIAGIWLDESTKVKLEVIGIKDSKLLSDKRCRELAIKLREICNGKFEEIEILPERYNELYEQLKKEGKNLNHLLAWGHARAIESLLGRHTCSHAVADQFGDEKFILSKLMEKGKRLELVQTPKGERYIAVAAASILARDRFLSRMEKLSQEYGTVLPKGASDMVVQPARSIIEKKGVGELKRVAKLHHKTTQKILEKT
jgi:ribonuclease HIII